MGGVPDWPRPQHYYSGGDFPPGCPNKTTNGEVSSDGSESDLRDRSAARLLVSERETVLKREENPALEEEVSTMC